MSEVQTVKKIVDQIAAKASTECDRGIALHDYVRENVKFGFKKYFDATPADYALTFGYGHCNPKSHLMVAFFRAAGMECYQHFVVIPKDILKDAIFLSRYWMIPAELSHSYVEVKVEGKWRTIDSFIVDIALLKGAQARLAKENRPLGYCVRSDSINTWEEQSDAFSQFYRSMLIEDHGRVDDLEAYFNDKRYRHVVFGVRFNTMFRLMGESGVLPMNIHIEMIQ